MNKLAPIALSLLLFFGGSLWYLANSELNENIKARIIQVSNYYTEQALSIDNVVINLAEGTGEIYGLKLKNKNEFHHDNMLTIEQVSFTFDNKSLNKKVIEIYQMNIKGVHFFIEKNSTEPEKLQSNVAQLYQLLNEKILLIQDRRRQKSEPYIQVNAVNVSELKNINIAPESSQSNKAPNSKSHSLAAIGKSDGLPASLFGIEVLRKMLQLAHN